MFLTKRILLWMLFALLAASATVWIYYSKSKTPINVVLISIDTLRPDHLGCYDYCRSTSPAIDKLASEGVLFKNAISTTTWTLPAHHALLTSLPNQIHGVQFENDSLDEHRITLAEIFKAHGYRTGCVFTAPFLLPRFGFNQGYDDYIDATLYDKKHTGWDELLASAKDRTTPGAIDLVEKWLDLKPEKSFFLFLHLFDVHADYNPPPPYDTMFDPGYIGRMDGKQVHANPDVYPDMNQKDLEHLIALYDGEIRFLDEKGINRLQKILDERNLLNNTLIVITSDHGEEFFEHGQFAHHLNLYDTTLRIPLILKLPGILPKNKVIENMISIIDIMPTILEIAGLPQSPEGLGRSLMPLIKGQQEQPRKALIELSHKKYRMEGLRTDNYKLILHHLRKKIKLLDLVADPGEKHSILAPDKKNLTLVLHEFNELKNRFMQQKEKLEWGGTSSSDIDEETRQRLQSLGYLQE